MEDKQFPVEQEGIDHSPMVFVPAHPVIRNGQDMAEYEMREMSNGVEVLPAFTSVKLLIEQLGKSQPWLRMPIRGVIDLVGPDHVAIDPIVDEAVRRWTPDELSEFVDRCGKHTKDVS